MVVSKRERFLVITTAIVVGAVLLYWFVVTPLLDTRDQLAEQIDDAVIRLDRADALFKRSRAATRRMREMVGNELKGNSSEAENQVLSSVLEWARDAGLDLSSVKPERSEKERDFNRITFRATGTGGMNQVGRFLWRIRTANMPVRVTDLVITPRKENTDDLSLSLGISTINALPTEQGKAASGGAAPREGT